MILMVHDGWVGAFWICRAGFDSLRCRGGEELREVWKIGCHTELQVYAAG